MRFTTFGLLVAMAAGTMAHAEMPMATEMNDGLKMLQTTAAQVLKQYGFEMDAMDLTLTQLAGIQGALASMNSESDAKEAIGAILAAK